MMKWRNCGCDCMDFLSSLLIPSRDTCRSSYIRVWQHLWDKVRDRCAIPKEHAGLHTTGHDTTRVWYHEGWVSFSPIIPVHADGVLSSVIIPVSYMRWVRGLKTFPIYNNTRPSGYNHCRRVVLETNEIYIRLLLVSHLLRLSPRTRWRWQAPW